MTVSDIAVPDCDHWYSPVFYIDIKDPAAEGAFELSKEELLSMYKDQGEKVCGLYLDNGFDNIVELYSLIFAVREKEGLDFPIIIGSTYFKNQLRRGAFGKERGVGNNIFAQYFSAIESTNNIEIDYKGE